MIILTDLQKYQLDFCLRHEVCNPSFENFESCEQIKKFRNKYDKFIMLFNSEVIKHKVNLERLQKIVEELHQEGKEIYISQATTSKIKYGLDPLINLFYWKGFYSRQTISNDWDNDLLFDEKKYNEIPKNIKGILSVRKRTGFRNYVFSQIKELPDSILRYSKWPVSGPAEDKEKWLDKVNLNDFPTWYELINEYKSSYCSFVVESDSGLYMSKTRPRFTQLNQCSEKTIIALLTKTIPIVLGGRGYIKELEDMGFWIANKELGFDIDNLPVESYIRGDKFCEGIEKYNKMTVEEISNFYEKNKDKIENNFKIISFFIWQKNFLTL